MKKVLTLMLSAIFGLSCVACAPTEQVVKGEKPVYDKGEVVTVLADCPPFPTRARLIDYMNAGCNTYVITEDANKLNTSGYIDTLNLCEELGLDVYIRSYDNFNQVEYPFADHIGEMYFDDLQIDFKDYPAVKGIFWWDEPNYKQYTELYQEQVAYHNEHFKDDFVFHINLFPSYATPGAQLGVNADENGTAFENYVRGYVEQVLQHVQGKKTLSLDHYPLRISGQTRYVSSSWLSDLAIVAVNAKAYNAIFNSCIQLYSGGGMRALESVADFGFQIYANMAFGAKSFELYHFADITESKGVMSGAGELYDGYYYVQEVLQYVHQMEHAYLAFDWQGVMSVDGEETGEPSDCFYGMQKYASESFAGLDSVRARADALVGHFVDKNGRNGYMVSNFSDPVSGITNVVELGLSSYTNAVVYYNGQEKGAKIVNGKLKLVLNKGEGAFVVPY